MPLSKHQTLLGYPVPPLSGHAKDHEHAVTTHWAGSQFIDDWKNPTKRVDCLKHFKTIYPRVLPFGYVQQLIQRVACAFGRDGETCQPFATRQDAEDLKLFATAQKRQDSERLPCDTVTVRAFEAGDLQFYAVFFPIERSNHVAPYWSNAGVGMSSRFAQDLCCLLDHAPLVEIAVNAAPAALKETASHVGIRERIASLLERGAIGGPRPRVSPGDVFLCPTGQSAIWRAHTVARRIHPGGTSVVFGLAFQSTLHTVPDFTDGPGEKYVFFGSGTELDELEALCVSERDAGRGVAFVFSEFPSNPAVRTPNLTRLRALADTYGFILVIDDTISGFANVDLLGPGGADILITSLTKAFNGHADAMAGSVVPNPCGVFYSQLAPLLKDVCQNGLYAKDAAVMFANSADYLPRCKLHNYNAATLAAYLDGYAANPCTALKAVYYPGVASCPSRANYNARMRVTTDDFTPGYGCLLSIEFESAVAAAAFFDTAGEYLHCGPHLGAHRTLLLQYVKMAHGDELEKVASFGYVETQIRVAVGFADFAEDIIDVFKLGLAAADATKGELN